jgi:hypothetical protein
MSDSTAFAFNTQLRSVTTPKACADLFRAAIAAFGFDSFACGAVDLRDRDRRRAGGAPSTAHEFVEKAKRKLKVREGSLRSDPVLHIRIGCVGNT